MVVNVKSAKEAHITDFMKTQPAKNAEHVQYGPISNYSNKYLNEKLKSNGGEHLNRERKIHSEIELGHTSRKDFIPLMDQRNQHEERANGALIAGLLLRKSKPNQGQPLIEYAEKQRKKSQKVQRQMNAVKNAGHIDPALEIEDRIKLRDANSQELKRKWTSGGHEGIGQRRQSYNARRERLGTYDSDHLQMYREHNRERAQQHRQRHRERRGN